MIANKEFFDSIEETLREHGTIQEFEKENGKITRRVLIKTAPIPEDVKLSRGNNGKLRGYSLSFDPGRIDVFIVMDTETRKLHMPPVGMGKKGDTNRSLPDPSVVNHVIDIIKRTMDDPNMIDNSPICAFLNDKCDISVTLSGKEIEE